MGRFDGMLGADDREVGSLGYSFGHKGSEGIAVTVHVDHAFPIGDFAEEAGEAEDRSRVDQAA